MTEQEQGSFSGYAIVDVMGHQRYVGFVKSEAYGGTTFFRVDVPDLPEREYELPAPEYVGGKYCPKGTKVKRDAVPGHSKLIGAGSIYMISPCTEAAAMKAVEVAGKSELKLISLPPEYKSLSAPKEDENEFEFDSDEDDESEPPLLVL